MLKPKSPQASFYGSYLCYRIIPRVPPTLAPCPRISSSPARGWMGRFSVPLQNLLYSSAISVNRDCTVGRGRAWEPEELEPPTEEGRQNFA